MKKLNDYSKIYLGKSDDQRISLSPPSWDGGGYWGFGYLGNKNCHYHVDSLTKIKTYNSDAKAWTYENVNLFDGFKGHFGDSFIVKEDGDIWTLAELFKTFYVLSETAEVLGRGGSHMAKNPIAELIKNTYEVKRINENSTSGFI